MVSSRLKNYLAEGLLIVFSVLFALFISSLAESYKTKKRKNIAVESIKKELEQNQLILQDWKSHHTVIRDRVTDILNGKNDSLKQEFLKHKFFNLSLITEKGVITEILTNTAWESSKSTNIITEFDFEQVQDLTKAYELQSAIFDKSVTSILELIYDKETHNMDNLEATLLQFQLQFWNLIGQEALLEHLYDAALKSIE